jgi:hypothetical protein
MDEVKETPENSKSPKIFFLLIILILIPIVLFALTKTNLTSKLKIPNNPISKNQPGEFNSKYFALKYPGNLKEEKSTPETGTLELKSLEKNGAFKISTAEYNAGAFEGDKTPLENAMDEAIKRERPYYAEYSGKVKIKGYDALIFSTDKPKDPATQKELPPLTAYYIYIPGEKDGAQNVKVVKIIYYGDEKESLQFEQLIDEIVLKNE